MAEDRQHSHSRGQTTQSIGGLTTHDIVSTGFDGRGQTIQSAGSFMAVDRQYGQHRV